MNLFRSLFPGFRTARRAASSAKTPYYRFWNSFFTSEPGSLEDLGKPVLAEKNRASQLYFEDPGKKEYWLNKPFSDPKWAPWFLSRFGLLLSGLRAPARARILDFGCGTGWTSIMMARMGFSVTGIDIAPAAIAIAQQAAREVGLPEGAGLRFIDYSGEALPFEDNFFDVAIFFEALHHLPNPKFLLREIHRVLSPYGKVGFAEPGHCHSETEVSKTEAGHGILENDLDIQQLYRSIKDAGFADMELLIPSIPPDMYTLSMQHARWYLRGFSWLMPSNFTRTLLLTAPIGIFWKGPFRQTSLDAQEYAARIKIANSADQLHPEKLFTIKAEVFNPTEALWLKGATNGIGSVKLGAHLLDSSGKMLEFDYGRAELPHDQQPGMKLMLPIQLRAPRLPGKYKISLDMVSEGICWFADCGSESACITIDVLAPSA